MKKIIFTLSALILILLVVLVAICIDKFDTGSNTQSGTTSALTTTTAPGSSSDAMSKVTAITTKNEYDDTKPTVCIDPGHGFSDLGDAFKHKGATYYEKDVNAVISAKIGSYLEDLGYNVIYTHNAIDLPEDRFVSDFDELGGKEFRVTERNAFIKENIDKIDLVISVHCGSSAYSSMKGSRYYINTKSAQNYQSSYALMAKVLLSVQKKLSLSKEPIWHEEDSTILDTALPSLLIKSGFITNQNEIMNLISDSWQSKYALSIAEGVSEYLKTAEDNPTPPTTTAPTVTPPHPTDKPTICIDPGHGFVDPGATVMKDGVEIFESTINMQVSLKLAEELEKLGYNVIFTHDGVTLPDNKYLSYTSGKAAFYVSERNDWLYDNLGDYDLLVSVHCNKYTTSSPSGSRYYILNTTEYGNYNSSYKLMSKMLTSVKNALNLSSEPTWAKQSLAVLKIPRPAVLVECGFLSNPSDLEKLLDEEWQRTYAQGLAKGIAAYSAEYIEK